MNRSAQVIDVASASKVNSMVIYERKASTRAHQMIDR